MAGKGGGGRRRDDVTTVGSLGTRERGQTGAAQIGCSGRTATATSMLDLVWLRQQGQNERGGGDGWVVEGSKENLGDLCSVIEKAG